MDIQTIWLIALSAATPIAGFVGFAIQLRMVKKTRLENEKLQLEIARLKKEAEKADRRIVMATTEEVLRLSPSLRSETVYRMAGDDDEIWRKDFLRDRPKTFGERTGEVAIIAGLVFLAGHLLHDLYLLGRLIWGKF